MFSHTRHCLDHVSQKHSQSDVIVTGDFNKLRTKDRSLNSLRILPTAHPCWTVYTQTLTQVYTVVPGLWLSHHAVVICTPTITRPTSHTPRSTSLVLGVTTGLLPRPALWRHSVRSMGLQQQCDIFHSFGSYIIIMIIIMIIIILIIN